MKKLITICSFVFLLGGLVGAAAVMAAPYGTDITVYDQESSGATGWWNQGTNPGEDQEVTFAAAPGQQWDLEGFQLNRTTNVLTVVGGFNFPTGQVDGYTVPLGDIFLKTGSGIPLFGTNNIPIDNHTIMDNSTFGYNYAVRLSWNPDGTTTYSVYRATDSSQVMLYGKAGDPIGYVSNPLKIMESTWTLVTTGTFTYLTGQTDAQVGGYLGGNHNIITGIDLSFLGADAANFWAHLTYDCGNDNLMGQVPLPSTLMLLGSGLLGLAGLGWRRTRKES